MLESVWTKEDEFLCLLVWNCLNVRQKNWLDWPSCFFVLEESEVKTTQKCFKKFLHKDEVISKVKKQKEEDTSISGSIKNHLLGKHVECHTGEKCSKLFKTSLKMTKKRIQPKMGYFLIWKEFVFVDFRQWIRQHVQCCKKIHSVFITFLWSWTEDHFRDDIFFVLLKIMPKGHTEMVSFYWQTWEEVTLKRNLWSFEKFWFYWSWCSKLSGKKKKKSSRNSPKLARQIAMPSRRPPLLASWIKKEFLCGSFYAQVMLESVWTKEDEFLCLLVWNCLNVRQKNWLDWPSCFFVLEESEVKTTQKCFKKFLHKDEVISKVKKQKEEDTSISDSIKNHLLGKQLNVTLVKNVANFSKLL